MADKIAVMNHGVIEQLGTPREIYDRPAIHVRRRFHRLAADELPRFSRRSPARDSRGQARPRRGAVPEIHEDLEDRELVLGVRPEHVRFADTGSLRGEVFGAEYLGTTQIVTLDHAVWHAEGASAGGGCSAPRGARWSRLPRGEALAVRQGDGARGAHGAAGWRDPVAEVILAEVSKRFGTVAALTRLSLAVGDGEFVVLLVRPAPARPRLCASSPGLSGRTRGASPSLAAM